MTDDRAAELRALADIADMVRYLGSEMATWSKVQNTIIDMLEILGAEVARIAKKTEADDNDVLANLLGELVANGQAHAVGLQRIENRLTGLSSTLRIDRA